MEVKELEKRQATVSPGLPACITKVNVVGDVIAQGDMMIELVNDIPRQMILVEDPGDADRQLVPDGSGPGSHHRLASLEGVRLYRPKDWGPDYLGLVGPCMVLSQPNEIVHEREDKPHGTVKIDVPCILAITYQRNLAADERAFRALD